MKFWRNTVIIAGIFLAVAFALLLLTHVVHAAESDLYCFTPGASPAFQPCSSTNPLSTSSGGGGTGVIIKRVIIPANITSIAIDVNPGQLFGIEAYNNGTVIGYLKLYNAAQGSVTCGTGTPIYEGMVPAPSAGGGGYVAMNVAGAGPFTTAITACFTGGITDADTTVPTANTYVLDFYYK